MRVILVTFQATLACYYGLPRRERLGWDLSDLQSRVSIVIPLFGQLCRNVV